MSQHHVCVHIELISLTRFYMQSVCLYVCICTHISSTRKYTYTKKIKKKCTCTCQGVYIVDRLNMCMYIYASLTQ